MNTLLKKYSCLTKVIILINLLVLSGLSIAQEELNITTEKDYYRYDQDYLSATFHKQRRDSLRSLLPDSSVAVLFSAPARNRSNDVYYEYHQDPDFYYLTGFMEPNSMVLIYKEERIIDGKPSNEVLFVPERNPQSEMWNGRRLGKSGAEKNLAFKKVMLNKEFKGVDSLFDGLKSILLTVPYAMEKQDTTRTDNLQGLYHFFQKKLPATDLSENELEDKLKLLRQKKTPEEIALIKKAIDITCEAQNTLMQTISEEMTEYQTEAIIEYVFKKNGAEYPGFPSIQGSGENSCILHYTSNRRPLANGGLLVSDVGAEYRGYTADVTRTIPPSGKFTEEEKIIYRLVLKAQEAGIEAAQVGNSFWYPHKRAQEVITEGLLELGIIKNQYQVMRYFMHGTSHYLGLDVHDAGLYTPFEEGNVITVEPGIYIAEGSECDPKWWNIGVRIEDDILITQEGPVNLSKASPRTVEEIEAYMAKKRKVLIGK